MVRLDGKDKHTLTAQKLFLIPAPDEKSVPKSDFRKTDYIGPYLPNPNAPATNRLTLSRVSAGQTSGANPIPLAESTFQLSLDPVRRKPRFPGNAEYVWLATNLAIFDVALPFTGRLIHRGFIPLSAPRANKSSFQRHAKFLPLPLTVYRTEPGSKANRRNDCRNRSASRSKWKRHLYRRGTNHLVR
jgi:hypothetical protein